MKSSNVLKNMAALAILSACAFTGNVFAEREKAGNGGNAGVCFNSSAEVKKIRENQNQISNDQLGSIVSIKALELYQAKAHFLGDDQAKHYIFPKAGEEGMDYVKRIASRFHYILPDLQDQLNSSAAHFEPKKYTYNTETGIEPIYDTKAEYYLDPSKCVVATLIRRTNVGGKVKLDYDWRLFNHKAHKNVSRGVLMLHEVAYEWATHFGQDDSYNTRQLIVNALIARDVSRKEVIEELRNDGFSVDSSAAEGTLEFRYLGSFDPIVATFDAQVTSPAFRESARKLLNINIDESFGETLGAVRSEMVRLPNLNFTRHLPRPKKHEARILDDEVYSLKSRLERCNDVLGSRDVTRSELKKCRQEIPVLSEKLAKAKADAKAKHEEAAVEAKVVGEQQIANEIALRGAVSTLYREEFLRLSGKVPALIDAYVRRIDDQPWFDGAVASALKERAGCLKIYFGLSTTGKNDCASESNVFIKAWQVNPSVPVIE